MEVKIKQFFLTLSGEIGPTWWHLWIQAIFLYKFFIYIFYSITLAKRFNYIMVLCLYIGCIYKFVKRIQFMFN